MPHLQLISTSGLAEGPTIARPSHQQLQLTRTVQMRLQQTSNLMMVLQITRMGSAVTTAARTVSRTVSRTARMMTVDLFKEQEQQLLLVGCLTFAGASEQQLRVRQ
jgi:hypothetical protein